MRDFDKENRPIISAEFNNANDGKKYNYEFDSIVRYYMLKSFEPYFSNGPALEIGCYHGDSTLDLQKYFKDLTIIEPSAEAIEITKKRVREDIIFHHCMIEDFNDQKKFDSIFLINTLEHVDDAVSVLKVAKTLLSKYGRLYILVPNADAPSRQIAVLMGLINTNNSVTNSEYEHGHRRTYSFDSLTYDVRSSNIDIQTMGGIIFKGLANYQFDLALQKNIITPEYLEASYKLGLIYPSLTASIFCITKPNEL
jgi:SAM-dependent methyltransferase